MPPSLDLYSILDGAGVDRLREGRREISGACPQHVARVGHVDRHPSWSISKTKYTHHCFSCGYTGTLSQLLTDLGHPPSPNLEMELKQESFLRRMAEQSASEILAPVTPTLTEWALINIMGDVPQRLLDLRHLQRPAVDAYGVRWDKERKCWVMPIRDAQGGLQGAQYRQSGNVFTDPEGLKKSEYLFGLSFVQHYDHVVLVESPLDSIRLFGLGIPAVAALGSWVSDAQAKLLARIYARVFLALDNDKAGREGAKQLFPTLRKFGAAPVMWYYNGNKAKDVGDVETDAEVLAMWNATLSFGMG